MNAYAKMTTIIDQFPIFDCLTEQDKKKAEEMLEFKVKPKYSFIYLPDEPSDTIYLLAKGTVKIGTHSSDGKEVIKNLIHPKSLFGELGLIGETHRQDFAQALKEEVHLYSIKVEDFSVMRVGLSTIWYKLFF